MRVNNGLLRSVESSIGLYRAFAISNGVKSARGSSYVYPKLMVESIILHIPPV
jgi:hypothetical protein